MLDECCIAFQLKGSLDSATFTIVCWGWAIVPNPEKILFVPVATAVCLSHIYNTWLKSSKFGTIAWTRGRTEVKGQDYLLIET